MRFSVCGDVTMLAVAEKVGFDFCETSVSNILCPDKSDSQFKEGLSAWQQGKIRVEACNCLISGNLKITGQDADLDCLTEYAETVMSRAKVAEIRRIVFGSGGARKIPDGFDQQQAETQLKDFLRVLGDAAAKNDVIVTVEPLNQSETNVWTSVRETYEFIKPIDHPAIRLLVDAYHWYQDGLAGGLRNNSVTQELVDSLIINADTDILKEAGPAFLRHAHLATIPNRLAPGREPTDFSSFFNALAAGNYQDGLSLECSIEDDKREQQLTTALDILRSYTS